MQLPIGEMMNEKALFSLFKVNSEEHSLAEIPARRRALDQDGLGTVDDPFAGCLCYTFFSFPAPILLLIP